MEELTLEEKQLLSDLLQQRSVAIENRQNRIMYATDDNTRIIKHYLIDDAKMVSAIRKKLKI